MRERASPSKAAQGSPRLPRGIHRTRSHHDAWFTCHPGYCSEFIKRFQIGHLAMDAAQRDQALERRPSSAWARKMLPLIRAKTIVTVSIIAVVLWPPDRTERRVTAHSQNNFAPRRKSDSD